MPAAVIEEIIGPLMQGTESGVVPTSRSRLMARFRIDQQQHLVREIGENATFSILSGGASASPAPTSTANAASVDLTMDFSYSAAPLHVTPPPAASTVSFAAFL